MPPTAKKLRELLHMAQIVQSHALSFFHLSAPDLLLGMDYDPALRNVAGLLAKHPAVVQDGVRLRKFGQQVIERLGHERVHPSWTVPGGVNAELDPAAIHVVVGNRADDVMGAFSGWQVNWVLQSERLGTGHAVMQALPGIAPDVDVDRALADEQASRDVTIGATLGDDVAAAIVPGPDVPVVPSDSLIRDVRRFVSVRLADFKVPQLVVVGDEVPKGSAGKVRRLELAERLDQALAALLGDFSRARLQQWIREGRVTVNAARRRPEPHPQLRAAGGGLAASSRSPRFYTCRPALRRCRLRQSAPPA